MKAFTHQLGGTLLQVDYLPGCIDVLVLDTFLCVTTSVSMSMKTWRALNQAIEDAHSKGYENDN